MYEIVMEINGIKDVMGVARNPQQLEEQCRKLSQKYAKNGIITFHVTNQKDKRVTKYIYDGKEIKVV